jgi:hypothetical protein
LLRCPIYQPKRFERSWVNMEALLGCHGNSETARKLPQSS